MSNNLRKFSTEADYTAATLNYPAVSWVVSGDTVHFDKTAPAPTPANDKVMMGFQASNDSGHGILLYNCGSSESIAEVGDIDINDDNVGTSNCEVSNYTTANEYYTVKYTLADGVTTINDWFSGDLGEGNTSDNQNLEICFPPQTTEINNIPSNAKVLISQATTPPVMNENFSGLDLIAIYVPDDSLNDYINSTWNDQQSNNIYPVSQYNGNLPI